MIVIIEFNMHNANNILREVNIDAGYCGVIIRFIFLLYTDKNINIGTFKGNKGKVTQVYRKRWCVYVEKISKSKLNGMNNIIFEIIFDMLEIVLRYVGVEYEEVYFLSFV